MPPRKKERKGMTEWMHSTCTIWTPIAVRGPRKLLLDNICRMARWVPLLLYHRVYCMYVFHGLPLQKTVWLPQLWGARRRVGEEKCAVMTAVQKQKHLERRRRIWDGKTLFLSPPLCCNVFVTSWGQADRERNSKKRFGFWKKKGGDRKREGEREKLLLEET